MSYPCHTVKTTCEVSSDSSPSIGDTAAAQRMSSNEECISGGTVCTPARILESDLHSSSSQGSWQFDAVWRWRGRFGEDDVEISFVLIRVYKLVYWANIVLHSLYHVQSYRLAPSKIAKVTISHREWERRMYDLRMWHITSGIDICPLKIVWPSWERRYNLSICASRTWSIPW